MEPIITHPLFATFFGWLAFNVIMFRIEKDAFDDRGENFPLWKYMARVWDNWLASGVMIPVILFVGYRQLDINPLVEGVHGWNDLYFLNAGFAPELLIVAWKKWKNKNS